MTLSMKTNTKNKIQKFKISHINSTIVEIFVSAKLIYPSPKAQLSEKTLSTVKGKVDIRKGSTDQTIAMAGDVISINE